MADRKFYVATKETVARTYLVRADSASEAKAKFEAGEYDREYPGECEDCEVVSVEEVTE